MAKSAPTVIMARQLAHRAAHAGAKIRSGNVEWDVAGSCQSPVRVEYWGRKHTQGRNTNVEPGELASLTVWMDTPCRKCEACRRYRAKLWNLRCKVEMSQAKRTWFGTLTLRPEEHYKVIAAASARLARNGLDLEKLEPADQWREKCRVVGKSVTDYIKRIRANSSARGLKYVLVFEKHESGAPHVHMLLHETTDSSVTKRCLQAAWPLGFTAWKLAEGPGAARYVTKYVSKSMDARVRASLRYGLSETNPSARSAIAFNKSVGKRPTPPHFTADEYRKKKDGE